MGKIVLSTGVKNYEIEDEGGRLLGVLRFNPGDPNLGARFLDLYREIPSMAERYEALVQAAKTEEPPPAPEGEDTPDPAWAAEGLEALRAFDRELKERLGTVFGPENDFERLLDGVNVMAMTDTGSTVLENLLDALLPEVESSADQRRAVMEQKAEAAARQAAVNREQRRALAKK